MSAIEDARPGKVFLVGAGPGDPGLITVKGLACLRAADIVVHDRLIDRRLLDQAKPGAELLEVGKVAGCFMLPQDEINALLVRHARGGKTVVRLKGGDPFVFGRGAEEAAAVVAAGLCYEVVPGVTAAIAAPAYAGIPVSQRDGPSAFAVVAGRDSPDRPLANLDWPALARLETLVFLMAAETLPQIVAALTAHGRPVETPIALVQSGTLARQKTIVGTLADIVGRVRGLEITASTIVVGEVVARREALRWFDNRPLFGRRVLVTRAQEQSGALVDLLEAQGAAGIVLPAIVIAPLNDYTALDRALERLPEYDWVIFTSANGVRCYFDRLAALGRDARALAGIRLCAIGPATAHALGQRGLRADYVPEKYVAEAVVAGLREQGVAGKRFLLPRALEAREVIVVELARAGATVDEIPVYQTVVPEASASRARELFANGEIDLVTFTSSSTVRNLIALLDGNTEPLRGVTTACIGPITANTAREAGLRVDVVAAEHTIPGLVSAILDFSGRDSRERGNPEAAEKKR